ncbi:MAG: sensor histidine kinase, partial [Planctomycetota bacterium]
PVDGRRGGAAGTVRTVGDDAPPAPLEHALSAPLAAYARRLLDADPGDNADAPTLVCGADGGDGALWARGRTAEEDGERAVYLVTLDLSAASPASLLDFRVLHGVDANAGDLRDAGARAARLRSLGELASGLVHEFSQPVSGIRGFAETLLLGKQRGWEMSDDELVQGLGRIVDLTGRLGELIEHVRGFATDRSGPERMAVRAGEVIDAALLMLAAQLRSHGIRVRVEQPDGELEVHTNPFLLEEAILALLGNARDALDDLDAGRPREIRVRLLRTPAPVAGSDAWALLEVEDTGPGIPAEHLDRVQEPFFTTKGPDQGMGLGLSRVRRTAELSGGVFALEPGPDGGVRARIVLPLADGVDAEDAS